ncbi:MAG: hypothetical protein ACFFFB_21915 [Candidatus Heimdallarchaeota archaeon]
MDEIKKEKLSKRNSLDSYLNSEVIKNAKRLKNRYPPISEMVDGARKVLKVQDLYELSKQYRNFYIIKVRNYQDNPKVRYFLANILASQSSDFLVIIAKDYIKDKDNIKLIQFSIHPKNLRISLLALYEIKNQDEFSNSIELLRDLRNIFRKRIANIKNLL